MGYGGTLQPSVSAPFGAALCVMRTLRCLFFTLLLTGCAPITHECDLAPRDQGWHPVDEPPPEIAPTLELSRDFVVLWFKDSEGRYLSCNRLRLAPGCGESATIYTYTGGKGKSSLGEIIVC